MTYNSDFFTILSNSSANDVSKFSGADESSYQVEEYRNTNLDFVSSQKEKFASDYAIDRVFKAIESLKGFDLPQNLITSLYHFYFRIKSHTIFSSAEYSLRVGDEEGRLDIKLLSRSNQMFKVTIYYDDEESSEFMTFLRYQGNNSVNILNGTIDEISDFINNWHEKD